MSAAGIVFGKDLLLDEEAFDKAVQQFADLGSRLQQLRTDIEEMLMHLKVGFDTPAGRKFLSSCEKNLLTPLDDQKLVLDHISTTLLESKQAYTAVFQEYENLQAAINQKNS